MPLLPVACQLLLLLLLSAGGNSPALVQSFRLTLCVSAEKLAPPQRACLSAGAKNTRRQMHHMPGRRHALMKESPGPERKQVPFVSRWIVQRPPAGGGQAEVLVRYHIMPL